VDTEVAALDGRVDALEAVPDSGITQLTGDVTTASGSGAQAATIADGSVSFAKMQAVSADVLLGNDGAGTAVQEIPCTAAGRALLDDVDAAAQRVTLSAASAAEVAAAQATADAAAVTAADETLLAAIERAKLASLIAALAGDCVLSGGVVTAQGSPDGTVAMAKAGTLTNGILKAVAAANVTVGNGHATLGRLDLIVTDSAGAKQCRAGTAALHPVPPTKSANDVIHAVVYRAPASTTVVAGDITDVRTIRNGPVVVSKVVASLTHNTTSALQTFFSLTIPDGLFLIGRTLYLRMVGTNKMNSGSPMIYCKITYGGTTIFEDTSAAFTASAVRRPWWIDFWLHAQGSAVQKGDGLTYLGRSAAPTAPATGIGDFDAVGLGGGTFGSAAVNADAADRTLTVQLQMSVSHIDDEITMDWAEAVLS